VNVAEPGPQTVTHDVQLAQQVGPVLGQVDGLGVEASQAGQQPVALYLQAQALRGMYPGRPTDTHPSEVSSQPPRSFGHVHSVRLNAKRGAPLWPVPSRHHRAMTG
jgi:hypothetical protein